MAKSSQKRDLEQEESLSLSLKVIQMALAELVKEGGGSLHVTVRDHRVKVVEVTRQPYRAD